MALGYMTWWSDVFPDGQLASDDTLLFQLAWNSATAKAISLTYVVTYWNAVSLYQEQAADSRSFGKTSQKETMPSL
jgi:hypothetical protein